MRFRLFHKGLILTGVPLFVGLIFVGSFSLLLRMAEKDQVVADRYRSTSLATARLMALVSEAPYLLAAAVCLDKDDKSEASALFEESNHKFKELRKAWRITYDLCRPDPAYKEADIEGAAQSVDKLMQYWEPVYRLKSAPPDQFTPVHIGNLLDGRDSLMLRLYALCDFAKPLQEAAERNHHLQLVVLCLSVPIHAVMGIALALFYRNSILRRLAVIKQNTESLEVKKWLNPEMGGHDEIAELDHAFHNMQKQLLKSAESQRFLFNTVSDVICVLDAENRFLRISPSSLQNWQYRPDELVGKSLGLLLPEDSFRLFQVRTEKCKQKEQAQEFETRLLARKGEAKTCSWSVFWSREEECLYSIVHDITEQKRAETIRQQFMLMLSSDLKAPLSRIEQGFSILVTRLPAGSTPAHGKFLNAQKNVTRLVTLVDDLLKVEGMDEAVVDLKKETIALADLAKQAGEEVEILAASKQLSLEVLPGAGSMYGDRGKIMQVLVNLLSNAIKFSPSGKKITLSAERTGNLVTFNVIDEGRGVPESQQAAIFEKFKQAETADGAYKAGTGLGLPICKQIIEAHGGEIGLKSKPGKGSTFWFAIPADETLVARQGHPSSATEHTDHLQTRGSDSSKLPGQSGQRTNGLLRLPDNRAQRIPLAWVGAVLVGLPVIFELVLISILSISFLNVEQERKRILQQRDKVVLSSRLLSIISKYTTNNGLGDLSQVPKVDLLSEWKKSIDTLSELSKGDAESEKCLLELSRSSNTVLELTAHLQKNYSHALQAIIAVKQQRTLAPSELPEKPVDAKPEEPRQLRRVPQPPAAEPAPYPVLAVICLPRLDCSTKALERKLVRFRQNCWHQPLSEKGSALDKILATSNINILADEAERLLAQQKQLQAEETTYQNAWVRTQGKNTPGQAEPGDLKRAGDEKRQTVMDRYTRALQEMEKTRHSTPHGSQLSPSQLLQANDVSSQFKNFVELEKRKRQAASPSMDWGKQVSPQQKKVMISWQDRRNKALARWKEELEEYEFDVASMPARQLAYQHQMEIWNEKHRVYEDRLERFKADERRSLAEQSRASKEQSENDLARATSVESLLALPRTAGNIGLLIDRAAALEAKIPQRSLQLRQNQDTWLLIGLAAEPLVALLLALYFRNQIASRIQTLSDNAGRVAREEPLHELIAGNDELTDIDRAFHKMSTTVLEARQKERAVFDNCQDVLCILSADGKFVHVNPAAEARWGYAASELLQLSCLDLVHPDDAQEFRTLFTTVESDTARGLQCRIMKKGGKIQHSLWSASRKRSQKITTCTVRDVTDRVEAEQLRKEFVALVSHDLRTPLTGIRGVCEIAQEGVFGALPAPALNVVSGIIRNCDSLISLINDILDFEKFDSGKMQLTLEETNLTSVMASVKQALGPECSASFEISGNGQDVFLADRARLSQAIGNLSRFLFLKSGDRKPLRIMARRQRHFIELKIIDNGPAIADEVGRQVFNRYKEPGMPALVPRHVFQADLLLPLAARIIEAHGGRVCLERFSVNTNAFAISIEAAPLAL